MEESRLRELESHVSDLRVNNATLSASLEHLSRSVVQLQAGVDELTETITKSKGAIAVIGGVGLAAGSVIHWVLDNFTSRHP